MKKTIAIIVSMLFVLSVAGLGFAAEKKAAPATTTKKAAKQMSVTGEVASIDAKAMTLTVKPAKKAEVAVMADDKTSVKMGKEKKTFADVKMGDKVTVKYSEMDGKNMAKSIAVTPAPVKKEKKMEEKKPAEKPAAAPAEKKKTGGY